MRILVKEEASVELFEAYEFYEKSQSGVGDKFLSAVKSQLTNITNNPNLFKEINGFREAPVRKYPFVVVYKIEENEIVVFAIFHSSRNPKRKFK